MSRPLKIPKNKFKMKWSYGRYSVETVDHNLAGDYRLPYVELIYDNTGADGRPSKLVLATYRWNEDGGNLNFIGDRPFQFIRDLDIQKIWYELWNICEMLDAWYQKEVIDYDD